MGGVPGGRSSLREARPLLLAVDADPERLDRIETELERGFGVDFRVRGEQSYWSIMHSTTRIGPASSRRHARFTPMHAGRC